MTTEAPDPDEAAVSRESFDRVKGENAALQAKVDDLTGTVKDLGVKEIIRAHFTEKGLDGEGAEWAAKFAMPSIPPDTPADQLSSYLDENFARLYSTPADDGTATPADDGTATPATDIPTPDANEPPGFARPSPAGDGQPPSEKRFRVEDPEIKALIDNNDVAAFRELDKAGRIDWRTPSLETPG